MSTDWSDEIVILDLTDEPVLSDELHAATEQLSALGGDRSPHLVLNFAGVSYINSSNLAQLLKLKKRLGEVGRRMKLCSVSDEVWSIFMVTGLDRVFQFAPDPMTALAGLQLEDQEGAT
jgi:anti-anti-sigma factor